MKRAILVVLLSTACFGQSSPRYGWKLFLERGIVLNSSGVKGIPFSSPGKLRIEAESETGIAFGVGTKSDADKRAAEGPQANVPLRCADQKVTKSDAECELPNEPATLWIADSRGTGTELAGVLGAMMRSTKTADRAVAPNKVTIRLYRWACIENCPVPEAKAR